MPTYPNPAGGTMTAANDADAKAKGWTPSMGTFGINTYSDSGGGGNPTTPTTPGNTYKIDPADMEKLRAFFGQTSGFSREQLAETKRQFDAQMAAQEAQWTRQGLPELQIKQQLANLETQKFNEMSNEFRSSMGLDYLKTAASMGGPADYFQQQDFLRGAQQRGDVPAFLQSLQQNSGAMPAFTGPGSTVPLPQTAAGLAAQMGAPAAGVATAPTADAASQIQSMRDNAARLKAAADAANAALSANPMDLATRQAATAAVDAYTAAQNDWVARSPALLASTNGQAAVPAAAPATTTTTPGGYNPDQALSAIGDVFKRGIGALAPNSLEQLSPSELGIMQSGAKQLGYSWEDLVNTYTKSRIGQTASSAA